MNTINKERIQASVIKVLGLAVIASSILVMGFLAWKAGSPNKIADELSAPQTISDTSAQTHLSDAPPALRIKEFAKKAVAGIHEKIDPDGNKYRSHFQIQQISEPRNEGGDNWSLTLVGDQIIFNQDKEKAINYRYRILLRSSEAISITSITPL
jgi:hypothetical protein